MSDHLNLESEIILLFSSLMGISAARRQSTGLAKGDNKAPSSGERKEKVKGGDVFKGGRLQSLLPASPNLVQINLYFSEDVIQLKILCNF